MAREKKSGKGGSRKENPPQCVSRFFLATKKKKSNIGRNSLEVTDVVEELQGGGILPNLEICADDGRASVYEGPTCMWVQPPCWAFQLPKAVLPRSMHRISRFRVKLKKKKIVRRGCARHRSNNSGRPTVLAGYPPEALNMRQWRNYRVPCTNSRDVFGDDIY